MAKLALAAAPTNAAPTIDLNGGAEGTSTTLAYQENDAQTAIAPAATLADPDTADFAGGSLTSSIYGATIPSTSAPAPAPSPASRASVSSPFRTPAMRAGATAISIIA
jgi:hypothetical protein